MTIRVTRPGAVVAILVMLFTLAIAGSVLAADVPPPIAVVASASDAESQDRLITNTPGENMSPARLARFTGSDEVAAGAECPIGSGAYCSDSSPYCFLCRGEYACCWSREVWRCCD